MHYTDLCILIASARPINRGGLALSPISTGGHLKRLPVGAPTMSIEAQTLLMYARNIDSLARTCQQTPALDHLYALCVERANYWAEVIIAEGFKA
jgi:hypothetical protein